MDGNVRVGTIPVVEGPACNNAVLLTSKPMFLVSIANRDAFSNDTLDVVFDNWVSKSAVTVEGDQAVLSRIMQIVTSAV